MLSKAPFSASVAQFVANKNWDEVERIFNASAFARHLGINVDFCDPAMPRCEINKIEPFHLGGVGTDYVNGAVIAGMFDLVIGLTGIAYMPMGKIATSNVNIRMLKPVEKQRFHLTASVSQKVGNRVFSSATLFNYRGESCGVATGEIRVGIA